MKLSFPAELDAARQWFTSIPPTLVAGGRELAAELTALHPHGGRLTVTAGDWQPVVMEQIELGFRQPDGDARFVLRAAITGFERDGDRWSLTIAFLRTVVNVARTAAASEPGIACPVSFRPVLWGDHPWYFNYRLQLSVTEFVAGGMRVLLHGEGRGFLPDLPFQFQLALPGIGIFAFRARVGEIHAEEGGHGSALLEWLDPEPRLREAIARYLFMAVPGLAPERLENAGYPVPSFEYAGVFGFAQTADEIRDVLALRLEAYRGRAGSALGEVTDPQVMRDAFDAHALLLTVRVGGRLVGTTRLVFNNGDREKSEIARFCTLPPWLWDAGFVELSRSATLPGLRGRDVFPSLRRHALRVAYQSGFRYIVSDCEGHLLEPYLRRGARELGLTFVHPLEGKTLHVLYYDVRAILRGEAGDPAVWQTFWKPMAEFLGERHGAEFPEP